MKSELRRAVIFGLFLALANGAALGCERPSAPSGDAPSGGNAPSGGALCGARIAREWRGRTPNAKAEAYAAYLADAIKKFRAIEGNVGYQMMRETIGDETHFAVISYWKSREAIKAYAGEDIRKVRPAPRDPEFLIDPELTVMNYDVAGSDFGCR